ncbi:MAG: DNA repair protein RadA [Clostridiales Family XIII bacterium]|nr:DNA repair protein RadA [Clostridiales Family XIII bacterium]
MAKRDTVFVCQECGHESPKWMGQCVCGAWNSFVEERVRPAGVAKGIGGSAGAARRAAALGGSGGSGGFGAGAGGSLGSGGLGGGRAHGPVRLRSVDSSAHGGRAPTGISELDRVLGGGLVAGSLTLIAGEPGIGKSTLILQAAVRLAASRGAVLYVSGEESAEQIKLRADRLSQGGQGVPENLYILSETNIESILAHIQDIKPVFLIIDSIQTMYTDYIESAAGSVSQIRACTNELMGLAKLSDIPVFIVAHVTKAGELAGPKVIEHLVDCVLLFAGDRTQDIRILRAQKNRFGTTSEIGAFEMAEEGLLEIQNLSGTLLDDMGEATEGAIATAVYEGTRPLLLEIQALTAAGGVGFPRRTAIGIELARLNMIIAVLERKAGVDLSAKDVYVNVVGGIRPEGTSVDLAVALAIYSSAKGIPVPPQTCAIGEIGLTGELRSVRGADKIASEAARLGFTRLILPKKNAAKLASKEAKAIPAATIAEAVAALKTNE